MRQAVKSANASVFPSSNEFVDFLVEEKEPQLLLSKKFMTQQKQRQEYLTKIAKIPPCEDTIFYNMKCKHGINKAVAIDCAKLSCSSCCQYWSSKNYWKVRHGLEFHGVQKWMFGTLTFDKKVSVEEALKSYYDFYRYIQRKAKRQGVKLLICRVVELTKKGNPHIHFLANACLPEVLKAKTNERTGAYYGRQSLEAKRLLDKLESLGFGVITHIEDVKQDRGGNRGVASYISKYLSKLDSKSLERSNGRRVRVIEFSRGWLPKQVPYFRYDNTSHKIAKPPEDCGASSLICGCDNAKYGSASYIDQINFWHASLPLKSALCRSTLLRLSNLQKRYSSTLQLPPTASRAEVCSSRFNAKIYINLRNHQLTQLKKMGYKGTLTFLLFGLSKNLFNDSIEHDSAGAYLCQTYDYNEDYLDNLEQRSEENE